MSNGNGEHSGSAERAEPAASADRRSVRLAAKLQTYRSIIASLSSILVLFALWVLLAVELRPGPVWVEAISVPRSLEDIGYTPETVAKRLIDQVLEIDRVAQAHTAKESSALAASWQQPDIQLGSGVSLQTVRSYARKWLGFRERRIDGEIVLTPGGHYQLHLREIGLGELPRLHRQETSSGTLDALLVEGSERVVHAVDPYKLAVYSLRHRNDTASARQLISYCLTHEPDTDDAWAHNLRGQMLQDMDLHRAAVDAYRLAIGRVEQHNPPSRSYLFIPRRAMQRLFDDYLFFLPPALTPSFDDSHVAFIAPYLNLLGALERANLHADLNAQYRELSDDFPRSLDVLRSWAEYQGRNRLYVQSLDTLQRALKLDNADPSILEDIADIQRTRASDPTVDFESAILTDSTTLPWQLNSSSSPELGAFRALREAQEIEALQEMLSREPLRKEAHDKLGNLLYRAGKGHPVDYEKIDAAIAHFVILREIYPDYKPTMVCRSLKKGLELRETGNAELLLCGLCSQPCGKESSDGQSAAINSTRYAGRSGDGDLPN